MKLQRTSPHVDLRAFPLDGTDTYLLSRVEDALTLDELAELMPCDLSETRVRVEKLRRAGLLTALDSESDAWTTDDLVMPELSGEFVQPGLGDDLALPTLLDGMIPTLDAPVLSDDSWHDLLPLPGSDEPESLGILPIHGWTQPEPEPFWEPEPFEVDPPSTLMSLFKRGPLQVEIHTTSSQSSRVTEGSNVFRKLKSDEAEPEPQATVRSRNTK